MEEENNVKVTGLPDDKDGKKAEKNKEVSAEELKKALEEKQKAEDALFMEDFQDLSIDLLISKGYVVKEFEIVPDYKVSIRTLTKRESLEIDKKASEYSGTSLYVFGEVGVDVLAKSIVAINGSELPDDEKKRKSELDSMSEFVTGAIWQKWKELRKAAVILVAGGSKNSLAARLLGPEQD